VAEHIICVEARTSVCRTPHCPSHRRHLVRLVVCLSCMRCASLLTASQEWHRAPVCFDGIGAQHSLAHANGQAAVDSFSRCRRWCWATPARRRGRRPSSQAACGAPCRRTWWMLATTAGPRRPPLRCADRQISASAADGHCALPSQRQPRRCFGFGLETPIRSFYWKIIRLLKPLFRQGTVPSATPATRSSSLHERACCYCLTCRPRGSDTRHHRM
jgi:hypothetical protein